MARRGRGAQPQREQRTGEQRTGSSDTKRSVLASVRRHRVAILAAGAALLAAVAGSSGLLTGEDASTPGSAVIVDLAPADEGDDDIGRPLADEATTDGSNGRAAAEAERVALVAAPLPGLVEDSAYGPLPAIGPGGAEPWQAYARPFAAPDGRPSIAIIITDVGLEAERSQAAVDALPSTVTLAIDPYAPDADDWAERARRAGHEVLMSLPLEAADFPFRDPGPMALLTDLTTSSNLDRLRLVLSRSTGYVGVLSRFGERFERNRASVEPVLDFIDGRGLAYVDGSRSDGSVVEEIAATMELPFASADLWLDDASSADDIDRALGRLEALARERGGAVGVGRAHPLVVDRLSAWAASVEANGLALSPVSAILERPTQP